MATLHRPALLPSLVRNQCGDVVMLELVTKFFFTHILPFVFSAFAVDFCVDSGKIFCCNCFLGVSVVNFFLASHFCILELADMSTICSSSVSIKFKLQ